MNMSVYLRIKTQLVTASKQEDNNNFCLPLCKINVIKHSWKWKLEGNGKFSDTVLPIVSEWVVS